MEKPVAILSAVDCVLATMVQSEKKAASVLKETGILAYYK